MSDEPSNVTPIGRGRKSKAPTGEVENLSTSSAVERARNAAKRAAQAAKSGRGEPEQLPAPSDPMAVARKILPAWTSGGHRTLRHWRGTWMRWDGPHWSEVDDKEIRSALYQRVEESTYLHVTKTDTEIRKWAPTKRKIADLMEATSAITHLSATVDAPAWLTDKPLVDKGPIVACRNGLLAVEDRKLLDLDPRFFNVVSVPFDYDPAAPEPSRWLKFLRDTWTDDDGKVDQDSINALQEFFGYVVSGRTDLHKILLVVGPPRSGKGTAARILTSLVGKGNMAGPTLASLASNFGLSPLLGKPLAIISDARLGSGSGEAVVERLLTISGEDTIDVDRKFKEPWTGRLPTRLMVLSNELPNFGDASGAIATRFIVLTMYKSWLGKENTALTAELITELPGILNWSLEGLSRLTLRGRFTEPETSVDAVIAMQDSASPMSAFVRERCTVGAGKEVLIEDMWEAWKSWCTANGRERPGTKQLFGRNLQSVVPQARRVRPRGDGGKQIPMYAGLTLKNESRNDDSRDSSRLSESGSGSALSRDESRPNQLQLQHSCALCGEPLDPSAGTIHPSCEGAA